MPDRLSTLKGYVRMSWHPSNLYNLQRLSYDPPQHIGNKLSFKRTSLTLFQQKWSSKRLLRAYHGDFLQERVFRRRFLPNGLPALEVTKRNGNSRDASTLSDPARIPLGSLMWRELEARLDVLVFRACFAHSVYEARRLVTQGHVKLNGKKMTDPNILLEPGDIFSVDPKEMYLLRSSDQPFEKQKLASASTEETETSEESTSEEASTSGETVEATTSEGEASTSEAQSTEASSEASTSTVTSATTPSKPRKSPSSSTRKAAPGIPFSLPDYAAPFIFLPAYLEVSFPTCSAIYVRHPTARSGYSEIPSPYDADGEIMRLGWEFYKGVGRRRRGTEDWGDEGLKSGVEEGKYDEKGRRKWANDWEELSDEKRRMRGVRQGRGKWANRPL